MSAAAAQGAGPKGAGTVGGSCSCAVFAATSWSVSDSARTAPPPVAVGLPVMVIPVTGAAAAVSLPVAAVVAVPAAVPAAVPITLPVTAGLEAHHSAACICSADHG